MIGTWNMNINLEIMLIIMNDNKLEFKKNSSSWLIEWIITRIYFEMLFFLRNRHIIKTININLTITSCLIFKFVIFWKKKSMK